MEWSGLVGTKKELKKNTIWTRNYICVFVIYAMLQFSHSAVNTLVSTYAEHLGAGPTLMGMVTGMLFAVALLMRPFIGPITAKFDNRLLLIIASLVGMFVYLGYALFHNIVLFVCFRVFAGFQYAIIGTLGLSMAADSVPEEKLASGLSMYTVGGAILAVIGPTLGISCRDLGFRIAGTDFGYTLVFLLGLLALTVSLITSICIRRSDYEKETPVETGVWYKNIIDIHALVPSLLGMCFVMGFANYTAYIVPFTAERGLSGASTFFAIMGIMMFVVKPLVGGFIEKFGIFKFVIPVTIIYAASFIIAGSAYSTIILFIAAVIGASGYSGAAPAFQTMAIQAVEPHKRSVASNTVYLGLDLGNFLGPFLGGIVYGFSNYGTVMYLSAVPVLLTLGFFLIYWPKFLKRRDALLTSAQK